MVSNPGMERSECVDSRSGPNVLILGVEQSEFVNSQNGLNASILGVERVNVSIPGEERSERVNVPIPGVERVNVSITRVERVNVSILRVEQSERVDSQRGVNVSIPGGERLCRFPDQSDGVKSRHGASVSNHGVDQSVCVDSQSGASECVNYRSGVE
ncbi:hypothetical protein chiPu_0002255 [Chiloscyllium punctatum]|uniref:Uncharacterized protein n=1 Tax=Chiloscyllium punctatum TaxID=137246 RepID=A0A401S0E3_CHIPU|nr:hypothetical protein [Chiloscyllium punctatum]